MTNLALTGYKPETTLVEYLGFEPITTTTPYIMEDVDDIIGKLINRKSFKAYVASIEQDIEKNPTKYINLSKKYVK